MSFKKILSCSALLLTAVTAADQNQCNDFPVFHHIGGSHEARRPSFSTNVKLPPFVMRESHAQNSPYSTPVNAPLERKNVEEQYYFQPYNVSSSKVSQPPSGGVMRSRKSEIKLDQSFQERGNVSPSFIQRESISQRGYFFQPYNRSELNCPPVATGNEMRSRETLIIDLPSSEGQPKSSDSSITPKSNALISMNQNPVGSVSKTSSKPEKQAGKNTHKFQDQVNNALTNEECLETMGIPYELYKELVQNAELTNRGYCKLTKSSLVRVFLECIKQYVETKTVKTKVFELVEATRQTASRGFKNLYLKKYVSDNLISLTRKYPQYEDVFNQILKSPLIEKDYFVKGQLHQYISQGGSPSQGITLRGSNFPPVASGGVMRSKPIGTVTSTASSYGTYGQVQREISPINRSKTILVSNQNGNLSGNSLREPMKLDLNSTSFPPVATGNEMRSRETLIIDLPSSEGQSKSSDSSITQKSNALIPMNQNPVGLGSKTSPKAEIQKRNKTHKHQNQVNNALTNEECLETMGIPSDLYKELVENAEFKNGSSSKFTRSSLVRVFLECIKKGSTAYGVNTKVYELAEATKNGVYRAFDKLYLKKYVHDNLFFLKRKYPEYKDVFYQILKSPLIEKDYSVKGQLHQHISQGGLPYQGSTLRLSSFPPLASGGVMRSKPIGLSLSSAQSNQNRVEGTIPPICQNPVYVTPNSNIHQGGSFFQAHRRPAFNLPPLVFGGVMRSNLMGTALTPTASSFGNYAQLQREIPTVTEVVDAGISSGAYTIAEEVARGEPVDLVMAEEITDTTISAEPDVYIAEPAQRSSRRSDQ